jgi:hypothetical protein
MTEFKFKNQKFIYFNNEWTGVIHAANNVLSDIKLISDFDLEIEEFSDQESGIFFATLNRNEYLEDFLRKHKVNYKDLKGKYESYLLQIIDNKLFVIGSDKRGTIYGLYTISDLLNVSPFTYWADADKHKSFNFDPKLEIKDRIFHGEPSVKYRGIFLNDEAPALTTFVKQFGENPGKIDDLQNTIGQTSLPIHESTVKTTDGYNSQFYVHVFDLILRLKGNYLWPAMWDSAFWIDDPQNAQLADDYGIIMGTTHQEFLASSDKEWGMWSSQFTQDGTPETWDYLNNKDHMFEFWRKNVGQRAKYENVFTMGMRGLQDTEILPGGTIQENVEYLNQVLLDQRKNFQENNLIASKVPQMIVLYKEVEEFYYAGWDKIIPDDIILTLADDNHGNLRSLPTEEMRNHSGGFGMYYHFDYYGGPRSYRWTDSISLERTREQMVMAHRYGVDKLWVVNVGDLKPLEIPIEYWFRLAYDIDEWGKFGDEQRFRGMLARREFGPALDKNDVNNIANIISEYQSLGNLRRPEWVNQNTFSFENGEWEDIIDRSDLILHQVEDIEKRIPDDYKDSFYHLVAYKVRSLNNVLHVFYHLGMNQNGFGDIEQQAILAKKYLQQDTDEMQHMNTINNGKWNGYGLEFHLGQYIWDTMKEQLQFKKYGDASTDEMRVIDYSLKKSSDFQNQTAPATFIDTDQNDENDEFLIADAPKNTYIEQNGYVSILSKNYVNNIPQGGHKWTILPNFGRQKSGLKVLPEVLGELIPGENSPYVEYKVYLKTAGDIQVITQWAPSNGTDFHNLTKLQYGIELVEADQGTITIVDTLPEHFKVVNELGNSWAAGVENQVRTVNLRDPYQNISQHKIVRPGLYTVRIYMVDDGLSLEKILIGTSNLAKISSWPTLYDPLAYKSSFIEKQSKQAAVLLPKMLVGPTDGLNNTVDSYLGPKETFHK